MRPAMRRARSPLTVTAVSDSRVYNGTTSSSGTPTVGTLFGSDTASFTQAFLSKDVLGLNGSTLRASGSVQDGNGGKDYSISFVDASGSCIARKNSSDVTTWLRVRSCVRPLCAATMAAGP
jgi:hypothetical protein